MNINTDFKSNSLLFTKNSKFYAVLPCLHNSNLNSFNKSKKFKINKEVSFGQNKHNNDEFLKDKTKTFPDADSMLSDKEPRTSEIIPDEEIAFLLASINQDNEDVIIDKLNYIKKYYSDDGQKNEDLKKDIINGTYLYKEYLNQHTQREQEMADSSFLKQWQKCLTHKELYLSSIIASDKEKNKIIDNFFTSQSDGIKTLLIIMGNAALDDLLRFRLDVANDYIMDISSILTLKDLSLLKSFVNSKKVTGNSFNSAEKVQLLNTFLTYKSLNINFELIENMVSNNSVDLDKLHKELIRETLSKIPINKYCQGKMTGNNLENWDIKNVHHLINDIFTNEKYYHDTSLRDLFIFTSFDTFNEAIHRLNNPYGIANQKTQKSFNNLGLNYQTWLTPPKSISVLFHSVDKNKNKVQQIIKRFTEDVKKLRETHVKSFIDKNLHNYIKDEEFVIPDNIINNKEKLINFIQNIYIQLQRFWKRALENSQNSDENISSNANKVLTIKTHLEQTIEDLKNMPKINIKKEINWKIKMWDRNPQKDIFQGNYSTCCIAMGKTNSRMMAHYLMNTMFNMMEIVDEHTGETIGNALLYYVTDDNNNPMLVIDNVEINNREKPSDAVSINLRNSILKFAQNINKEVNGSDNIPIILGTEYNDIYTDDLSLQTINHVSLVGDTDCEKIYLDMFKGCVKKTTQNKVVYYKLENN